MIAQEISEQIDVVLKCDEQLQFAQEVLQKLTISDSLRAEFQQKIDRIKARQQDPNLYLAVVGEFSSGKSTFINALLKDDDLLKTSALVATAAATKIARGPELKVEAQFCNGQAAVVMTKGNQAHLNLPWLPDAKGMEVRQFIHMLTSDQDIAKDVVGIRIEHPAPFLSNGVVIIDTPGTNADKLEHGVIAREVVEQEADLAIIVIPATVPLSQSLAGFLAGSLKPFLHRCIFVVSRIDEIKPQERNDLTQDLRARLVDKLGIVPPPLYLCSAQVMLDVLGGEERVPESLRVFHDHFIALEKVIVGQLSRERILSISESLLRLLSHLFQQLDVHLRSQWQVYEDRQAGISKEMIPNLAEFTLKQYSVCDQQLRALIAVYLSETASRVESHRRNAVSLMHAKLFGAGSEDALNNVLKSEAEQLLATEQQQQQTDLKSLTQKLSEDAIAIGKIFDREFSEVYRRLKSIGGTVEATVEANYSFQVNSSTVAVSARSLTQKLNSNDGTKMGLGATAGVAIGTILFPGVGTLVGLAAGTWASRLFMPSLDERKQKLWEQLKPGIDAYFDTTKSQTQEAAIQHTQSLEASLKQHIDAYIEKYRVITDDILLKQKADLKRLSTLRETTQIDLAEIERRKQRLAEQQKTLAAIS